MPTPAAGGEAGPDRWEGEENTNSGIEIPTVATCEVLPIRVLIVDSGVEVVRGSRCADRDAKEGTTTKRNVLRGYRGVGEDEPPGERVVEIPNLLLHEERATMLATLESAPDRAAPMSNCREPVQVSVWDYQVAPSTCSQCVDGEALCPGALAVAQEQDVRLVDGSLEETCTWA